MWSRRAVLRATAGGGAAALLGAGVPAWAADEFDTLRARWVSFLVGTGYDPAAEPFKTKLAQIGAATRDFRETMGPGAGWLWADLPLGTVSWNITSSQPVAHDGRGVRDAGHGSDG